MARRIYFWFVVILSAIVSGVQGQPASQPSDGPWALTVMHPSYDKGGLYHCILTIPADLPLNEHLGVYLSLIDRDGHELGGASVTLSEPIEGKRLAECRLSAALIKNSSFIFQINPNTTSVREIKASFGQQKSIRRVDGKLIREPIE